MKFSCFTLTGYDHANGESIATGGDIVEVDARKESDKPIKKNLGPDEKISAMGCTCRR